MSEPIEAVSPTQIANVNANVNAVFFKDGDAASAKAKAIAGGFQYGGESGVDFLKKIAKEIEPNYKGK